MKIFEDKFPSAVELIRKTKETKSISPECYLALTDIALFGIIGNLRLPAAKKSMDNLYDELSDNLYNHMTANLKKSFEDATEFKKYVKYSNLLSYSDTALRIYEKMGGLNFTIWHIQSDDCLLLPDCTAFTIRRKINNYYNPNIEEIAEIGIPVTDKIFVHALSKKLDKKKSYIAFVDKNHDKSVFDINYNLFHFAHNTLATSSLDFLNYIVTGVKDLKH